MVNKKFFVAMGILGGASFLLAPPPPPPTVPASPANFQGCRNTDIFLTQIDNYNYLTWAAPVPGPQPVDYAIYRADFINATLVLVAIVPASGILACYDHDRNPSVDDTYVLFALDASGHHGVPARTTVTENCN